MNQGSSGTVTFYVVRHGETLANRGGIFQGQMDVALSDVGRTQALAVGKALSGIRLDAVYSSDLSRAADTARSIMAHQQCPLVFDRRLRELHGGLCQGHTHDETLVRFPAFVREFEKDPINTRRPEGESFADLAERVGRAVDDIAGWHASKPGGAVVGLVGHGGVIRAILATAGLVSPLSPRPVGNCSVSVLENRGQQWVAVRIGDNTHLEGLVTEKE